MKLLAPSRGASPASEHVRKMGRTGESPAPVGDSRSGRARPQLRRSDLFVANGSHPAKSPVGAASSASMPLLRSFGVLPFAIYKYAAPLGLGKLPLALNSMAAGQWLGLPENDFPDWLLATRRPKAQRRGRRAGDRAFTLLEIMLAIMIFMMVLTAIYATWLAIRKGTQAGLKAAAEVQRSRIAVRTLEDAFTSTEYFVANMNYYLFFADTSGDMAAVSMAARLPASFPGVGRYGDQVVRRVSFYAEPGKDGTHDLIMTQAPILLATNSSYPP